MNPRVFGVLCSSRRDLEGISVMLLRCFYEAAQFLNLYQVIWGKRHGRKVICDDDRRHFVGPGRWCRPLRPLAQFLSCAWVTGYCAARRSRLALPLPNRMIVSCPDIGPPQ